MKTSFISRPCIVDSVFFRNRISVMAHIFTAHFHIRHYEPNSDGNLPNSTLARFFQETVIRDSAKVGYDVTLYSTYNGVWLIHDLTLERARPIHFDDELTITTWVSDYQRVRSHREYVARNTRTNEIVARGRAYWVYLNQATLMPMRITGEIIAQFAPNGVPAVSRAKPRAYPPPPIDIPEFFVTRRVQRYEADGMQHVNNAVYIDWLEEALADAVANHPSTALRSVQDASRLCVYRHDIEYARSAMPGDEVTISVRLVGVGKTASAWKLEIKRDDELLVRDHITALWMNQTGKPVKW